MLDLQRGYWQVAVVPEDRAMIWHILPAAAAAATGGVTGRWRSRRKAPAGTESFLGINAQWRIYVLVKGGGFWVRVSACQRHVLLGGSGARPPWEMFEI